jgi:hypothetical protein
MRREFLIPIFCALSTATAFAAGLDYESNERRVSANATELELMREMQGKSLDQLKSIRSIKGEGYSEAKKSYVLDEYDRKIDKVGQIDVQEVRSFLVRENLGVLPNDDIYQISASKKRLIDEVSTHDKSENKEHLSMYASIPRESIESTYTNVNGDPVWSRDPKFKNSYASGSSSVQSITPSDIKKMSAESTDCTGNTNVSDNPNLGIKRKDVYRCFKSLRLSLYKDMFTGKEFSYLQALNLVTTLVDNNGKHVCMASYYESGLWVTAQHCVTDELLLNGLRILSGGVFFRIRSDMLSSCPSGCDVAFIKASTPVLDLSHFTLQNADLKEVKLSSQLFIPGIEEGEVISSSDPRSGFLNDVMWPMVGEGYCRPFKLQNGCMSHTCSTLLGFSGSPVYLVDSGNQRISLIAIHTGQERFSGCDNAATNYAVTSNTFSGATK